MAADDYHVVMYKVLAYLYQCIKEGVEPSAAKAREVAKVNPVYYKAVVSDLMAHGYARADVRLFDGGTRGLSITSEGVEYLESDPKMDAVREFLGKAFETVVKAAIEATRAY